MSNIRTPDTQTDNVTIVEFTDSGERQNELTVPKVTKDDAEWQQQLSPQQYEVTRHDGTERAFTGEYWNNHEHGIYRCVCCGTPLFSSDTKFESGTGWPSFTAPITPENVTAIADRKFGMTRTAVSCRRCDAHLGHVFPDGPTPTGLRYGLNSASLKFIKGFNRRQVFTDDHRSGSVAQGGHPDLAAAIEMYG
ncbi:MAG TPA: peptide-methionine (R)-S-oxide reductase MsrB, partial [Candidatus Limnocylindrales bacterium]|nr:peptide-methionine (R)-S-oxide reductase MsrB [Candidatus Limnocylindrales bacterium]